MMRYKTLFRVLLKAIGVLLVGQAFPRVVDHALLLMYMVAEGDADWQEILFYPVMYGLGTSTGGTLVQLVLGLYLFFGGKWLTNLAIPDNRSYCAACGYQLTGREGVNCPHCGGAMGDPVTSGTL
jgi:hypothetical protein